MTIENLLIDTEYLDFKQLLNISLLIKKAENLWMPIYDSFVKIGYDIKHGYTYLACDDADYTLIISDFDDTIKALYVCHYDGSVSLCDATSYEELEKWLDDLRRKSDKKEGF